MSLTEHEYAVLRQTIATRGTVRAAMLPLTLIGWAAVLGAFGDEPHRVLLSLGILVGGFEAIHALHVGVERIGRYLQVYYETPDGPRWETIAMKLGPALPGGGIDPLFTIIFMAATVVNLLPAAQLGAIELPFALYVVLHLLFVIRLARARRAAGRQRAVDLETFREMQSKVTRDSRPTV